LVIFVKYETIDFQNPNLRLMREPLATIFSLLNPIRYLPLIVSNDIINETSL
jgi:hypothetical protein